MGSVASDVLGASGRMMLTIAEGEEDPECWLSESLRS